MRILVDTNTGNCLGVGDDNSWVGLPNAYIKPSFVDDQFWLWQWNKVGDIALQANWTKQPIPPKSANDIVTADELFCRYFLKYLFSTLRGQALTDAQRVTLLSTITTGMNALAWGDAVVARVAFNSIAPTALWTQARKDWVLLQLDTYINS